MTTETLNLTGIKATIEHANELIPDGMLSGRYWLNTCAALVREVERLVVEVKAMRTFADKVRARTMRHPPTCWCSLCNALAALDGQPLREVRGAGVRIVRSEPPAPSTEPAQ